MADSEKSAMADSPKKPVRQICFSDLDGTLVHYPEEENKWSHFIQASVVPNCSLWLDKATGRKHKVLHLPPSSTGAQGIISVKTLTELASIRAHGVALVLITGARSSTLLQRLPFLPLADAYVCENGGRIFYHGSMLPTAAPLTEDIAWRKSHVAAGDPSQDLIPAVERKGILWDLYRTLKADGWKLDATNYTTNFRIHTSKGAHSLDVLHGLLDSLPEGLAASFNLGMADVYPATSGKKNAALYLMSHFDSYPEACCFLCDDDNDIELAKAMGKVFVVGCTAESMRQAALENPDKFITATKGGTLATEEILEKVDDFIGTYQLG